MTDGSALGSDEWCTPKWLAGALGGYFDLDPCSNVRSHIRARQWCGSSHSVADRRDGLAFDWSGCSVYCNPPYSNVMPWAQKLAAHDGPWCALLKLDPTTKWWAELMRANPTVAPFRKRIKFEGDKAMTANFPSVLVFKRWWPSDELQQHLWLPRWT